MEYIKRISCPKCQAVLDVKNPQGVPVKMIVCPKCSTRMKVTFREEEPMEAHTFLAGAGSNGGSTVMAPKIKKGGQFRLRCGDAVYPLHDGVNTVGRKAQTSAAAIQIATESMGMSRHHAKIEVARYPGGVSRVRISNWQNKNATTVNGNAIKADDVFLIRPGDSIMMGDVTLELEVE